MYSHALIQHHTYMYIRMMLFHICMHFYDDIFMFICRHVCIHMHSHHTIHICTSVKCFSYMYAFLEWCFHICVHICMHQDALIRHHTLCMVSCMVPWTHCVWCRKHTVYGVVYTLCMVSYERILIHMYAFIYRWCVHTASYSVYGVVYGVVYTLCMVSHYSPTTHLDTYVHPLGAFHICMHWYRTIDVFLGCGERTCCGVSRRESD